MIARSTLGMAAMTLAGVMVLGVFAPQPAQASDAGRAIAGIVAGALVYELLDDNDHRGNYYAADTKYRRAGPGYQSWDRGRAFWNGNRGGCWQPPSPPRHNPRNDYRNGYRHGYSNGWNDGWRSGWNSGYNTGYNDGRWGTWGGWGGWGCY